MKIASEKEKKQKISAITCIMTRIVQGLTCDIGFGNCENIPPLIQRGGEIAFFTNKKPSFCPSERKIFGIWPQKNAPTLSESDFWGTFFRFGVQKSADFSHKSGILCPISENRTIFHRFSSLPRATGYQRNINEAYRKKSQPAAEKTRTFPHNADKTTEPSGSLYK